MKKEQVVEVEKTEVEEQDEKVTAADDLDAALEKALSSGADERTEDNSKKDEVTLEKEEKEEESKPTFEPPAEFNVEEKEAFKLMNPKAQEATLRVFKSRNAEIGRIHNERKQWQEENQSLKELAGIAKPYLEQGLLQGKDPIKATTEALGVVMALNKDPIRAITAILKLKGLQVEDLTKNTNARQETINNEALSPVVTKVEMLERKLAAREIEEQGRVFGHVFQSIQQEQNAAGSVKYPSLTDDEAGYSLASEIGSLIAKPEFRRAVEKRIPGAGLRELSIEAYKWLGGRVDDAPANSFKSPQDENHINRAKRAAASVPGRPSGRSLTTKKGKSLGDALDLALEQLEID